MNTQELLASWLQELRCAGGRQELTHEYNRVVATVRGAALNPAEKKSLLAKLKAEKLNCEGRLRSAA